MVFFTHDAAHTTDSHVRSYGLEKEHSTALHKRLHVLISLSTSNAHTLGLLVIEHVRSQHGKVLQYTSLRYPGARWTELHALASLVHETY